MGELPLGSQKRGFTRLLQVPLGVDRTQSPSGVLPLLLTWGPPRWQSRPSAVNGRDCRVHGRSWLWRSIIYLLQLNSRLLSPAADKQVERANKEEGRGGSDKLVVKARPG